MPPLRAQKLQPHIVLNDIFKHKSNIAKRKNVITAVNTSRSRIPGEMDKKRKLMNLADTSRRTRSSLRSRCDSDVILIEKINVENSDNKDVILIDDTTDVTKPLLQPLQRDQQMKVKVVVNKRGQKLKATKNKVVDAIVKKKKILQPNTSQCARCTPRSFNNKDVILIDESDNVKRDNEDVILIDDKTDISKSLINCEAEMTKISAVSAKSRGRPLGKVKKARVVNTILKNKNDILRANGQLASERDQIWIDIKAELENKIAVSTLYRIANEEDVYKILSSKDEKNGVPCIPIVENAGVRESIRIDNNVTVYENTLLNLAKSIDGLTKELNEFRREFRERDNTAQKRKSSF